MTAETGAKWLLRFISLTTLPAFVGVAMPQRWLIFAFDWAEPGCPVGLFGSYITRCLLGVYAFIGIQAAIWSTDVRRYRPLILSLCLCVIVVVPVALAALVITVPRAEHARVFWIVFVDLAEGLVHTTLLAMLIGRVPYPTRGDRERGAV